MLILSLQSFDLVSLAELQLYKTLLKTKRIASAPAFPGYVTPKVQASLRPQDAAHANVQARLFNSNPVKAAMNEIISRIQALLGIEDTQSLKKKRIRAADYSSDQRVSRNGQVSEEPVTAITEIKNDQAGSDWNGFSDAEGAQEEDYEKNGNDDESIDCRMYDSRLAASSDEGSDVEDLLEEALLHSENPRRIELGSRYSPSRDLSLSSGPDDFSPSPSPSPDAQKAPGKSSSNANSTTFLPSLANGGYWSGSDSVASDLETDEPKARKNRRGQQERRAIWEKKYGRNANHLKKQGQIQNRDEGWDLRRGARSSDDFRGKRGRGRGRVRGVMERGSRSGRGGTSGATGANSDPVLAKKATATETSLHPSWEAAKKRKDEKKSAAFAGKKIVFS